MNDMQTFKNEWHTLGFKASKIFLLLVLEAIIH